MKKSAFNNVIDYIIKNKYVIIFVTIIVILALTGFVSKLIEFLFTVVLIILAVFFGKKLQEDDSMIKKIFKNKENKEKVVYEVKYESKKKE